MNVILNSLLAGYIQLLERQRKMAKHDNRQQRTTTDKIQHVTKKGGTRQ